MEILCGAFFRYPVEELVAELGGLEGVPEDQEVDHDGHGDSDDDDGEAADEHVEEIELGDEEDQENGYEAARRKEPSGPDTSTKQFERHTDSVYCVALSPSSSVAVSGGGDDVAYLWNSESGSEIACLKGHTDSVVAVAFSHDGKLVATGSYDSTVKVRLHCGAYHFTKIGSHEKAFHYAITTRGQQQQLQMMPRISRLLIAAISCSSPFPSRRCGTPPPGS